MGKVLIENYGRKQDQNQIKLTAGATEEFLINYLDGHEVILEIDEETTVE